MTMKNEFRPSTIALAVLALLYEAPMHPYRMQQLIKERGKDEVINVRQRASLYQTIDRLLRAKLIVVRETAREERRPERTIYELTEAGREAMILWMRVMLATPAREFPDFPAALAYLPILALEDARAQLDRRVHALAAELDRIDAELGRAAGVIPRLFLVEMEYLRAMLHTELAWVRSIVDDLDTGRLTWSEEWLRSVAMQLGQAEQQQNKRSELGTTRT
jgi:DNA-binding PadR family transcriptional regulator